MGDGVGDAVAVGEPEGVPLGDWEGVLVALSGALPVLEGLAPAERAAVPEADMVVLPDGVGLRVAAAVAVAVGAGLAVGVGDPVALAEALLLSEMDPE